MAVKNVIEAVRETLKEEMRRDPSIVVMGEDVGVMGGVFRATEGLQQEFGPDRVIDTPLAESAIVGVALGASLNGLRPVAEIQFADFIWGAADQIISEASKLRWRSNGAWGCPVVIRTPYGGGIRGGPYHSQSIEAFFAHVPGLIVVAPSTPYDVKGLLRAALRQDDPVLFLEHKKTYRLIKGELPEGDYIVPIGKGDVKREGSHLSVFSYGLMLHHCLQAAEAMQREGIEAEVVDLRSIRPMDRDLILASVRKTSKALIVYEDNRFLGVGSEVAALIAEEAFDYLDAPVMRIGAPEAPSFAMSPVLEDACLPSAEHIARAMRALARY